MSDETLAATGPMQLDGEVLNGRLVVYADSLGEGLARLALALADVDPLVLVGTGQTPDKIVADLAMQLLEAAQQYGATPTEDDSSA